MHEALNLPSPALLAEQLAATDANLRAAAIRALPVADSLAPLTKLIADENPRVRLAAVRALGKLGTARAAELALLRPRPPNGPVPRLRPLAHRQRTRRPVRSPPSATARGVSEIAKPSSPSASKPSSPPSPVMSSPNSSRPALSP